MEAKPGRHNLELVLPFHVFIRLPLVENQMIREFQFGFVCNQSIHRLNCMAKSGGDEDGQKTLSTSCCSHPAWWGWGRCARKSVKAASRRSGRNNPCWFSLFLFIKILCLGNLLLAPLFDGPLLPLLIVLVLLIHVSVWLLPDSMTLCSTLSRSIWAFL